METDRGVKRRKNRRVDARVVRDEAENVWVGLEGLESRLLLSATLDGLLGGDSDLSGLEAALEVEVDHPGHGEPGHVCPIFAPGTPIEMVEQFHDYDLGGDIGFFQEHPSGRWTTTLTDGSGLRQGDATTLTWSIVPDGTFIDNFGGSQIPEERPGDSDLVAWLDGIYGSAAGDDLRDRPWFRFFNEMFERWSEVSGMNYIYEPNDDGVALVTGGKGELGVRGEVRIGGHFIDGTGNVLAYNFFPVDSSNMVIDTGDNLFADNLQEDSLFLRNTLSHEHGHGLGFSHVEPTDNTKLMEPFLNLNFNGPQLDDVLAAQRLYGDEFEENGGNDSALQATNLGPISGGSANVGVEIVSTVISGEFGFVSIDGTTDEDFYSFTVLANQRVGIQLEPQGVTYLQGPQGGGSVSFNAKAQNNLGFTLIDSDGQTTLLEADFASKGETESVELVLLEAGVYYIKVHGNQDAVQLYTLDVTVEANEGGSAGSVTLDAEKYLPDSTVGITVSDVDQAGVGSIMVTISSLSGDFEGVTLIEQIGGLFTGSIDLGSGGSIGDGVLDVNLEDEIVVSYADEDNGSGGQSTRTDTAIITETLTETREYVSQDVPLVLEGLAVQTSYLEVPAAGVIQDLDVTLTIDHKNFRISNLLVTLVAPNGQAVILFDGVGGFGTDMTDTVLDDEADIAIQDGQAPFTGSFRPMQPLSDLDGKNVTGVWGLEILDTTFEVFQSTGALLAWSIIVETGDEAPPPPPPPPDPDTPAPGVPDLAAESDTGASDSDNLTRRDNSNNEQTLTFVVPQTITGATVELFAGSTKIGQAVAEGTSTTIVTNGDFDLQDGSHPITAKQTESGKPTSASSSVLSVTVDTQAPVVTVDPLETEDFTPALAGDVNDPTASVQITVGGQVHSAVVEAGRWALADDTISPELEPGRYDVIARATDRAGNVGQDETVDELLVINPRSDFESDDVPVELVGGPHLSVIEVSEDGFVHDLDVKLNITHSFVADLDVFLIAPDGTRIELFTDVGSGGNNVLGTTLDDEAEDAIADGIAPFEGRYRPEGSLADADGLALRGLWTLEITDDLPNDIDSGVLNGWSVSFEVGPEFSTPTSAPDLLATSDSGFNSADDLTRLNNDGPENILSFHVSNVEPGAVVTLLANGAPIGQATAVSDEVVIDTNGVDPLDKGKTEFTAVQVGEGKAPSAPSESLLVTVDKTAPVLTVDEMLTNDTSPILSGTVDDPDALLFVTVGGIGVIGLHDQEGRWSIPDDAIAPALEDGIYDVQVVAVDVAGNTGSDVTSGELRIDVTPPEVVIEAPTYTQDNTPGIVVQAVDPSGIREGSLVVIDIDLNNDGDFDDPGELGFLLSLYNGGSASVSDTPALHSGVYGLRANISDSLGNEGVSPVEKIVIGTDLPGDFDFDLDVDVADLIVWASHFGESSSFDAGDANLDGIVSVADLILWSKSFGQASEPVPVEPVISDPLVQNSAAVSLITEEASGDTGDHWSHIRNLIDRAETAESEGVTTGIVNLLRGGLRGLRVAVMAGIHR
ncbi:MAG: Ig-like domain-containing protein [Planctomycetota bacterium]